MANQQTSTEQKSAPTEIEETEKCVLCGEGTGIPRSCSIYDPQRNGNYVEGAGQLCESCGKRKEVLKYASTNSPVFSTAAKAKS